MTVEAGFPWVKRTKFLMGEIHIRTTKCTKYQNTSEGSGGIWGIWVGSVIEVDTSLSSCAACYCGQWGTCVARLQWLQLWLPWQPVGDRSGRRDCTQWLPPLHGGLTQNHLCCCPLYDLRGWLGVKKQLSISVWCETQVHKMLGVSAWGYVSMKF